MKNQEVKIIEINKNVYEEHYLEAGKHKNLSEEELRELHMQNHGHYHENTKAVVNRISRMIGHLEKVRDMVERGEDCSEVLTQLAAVKGAINSTSRVILKDHMQHCIVHAIEDGNLEMVEQLNEAIDKMMK